MIGYYFITDSELSKAGNFSDVQSAISADVSIVQYRNKNISAGEIVSWDNVHTNFSKDTNATLTCTCTLPVPPTTSTGTITVEVEI